MAAPATQTASAAPEPARPSVHEELGPLRRAWLWLVKRGVTGALSIEDQRFVRNVNAVSVIGIVVVLASFAYQVGVRGQAHTLPPYYWIGVEVPIFAAALLLNHLRLQRVAAAVLVFGMLEAFLADFLLFGTGSGAQYFLLLGAMAPTLLLPSRMSGLMWFAIALAGVELAVAMNIADSHVALCPGLDRSFLETLLTIHAAFIGMGWASRETWLWAERRAEGERARSERLLLSILPETIARRLKGRPERIAEGFDDASVLFADIVGFTPMAESLAPTELVQVLDELFSRFDEEVDRLGLEKIKTIGDAYMVVGGLPSRRAEHLEASLCLAASMIEIVERWNEEHGGSLALRIGVHRGPVVAGVIGRRKQLYDLWGDTVNTASRMESHGVPGRIQVSSAVVSRLDDGWAFEPRGAVDIKGKGPVDAWLLETPGPEPLWQRDASQEADVGEAHATEAEGLLGQSRVLLALRSFIGAGAERGLSARERWYFDVVCIGSLIGLASSALAGGFYALFFGRVEEYPDQPIMAAYCLVQVVCWLLPIALLRRKQVERAIVSIAAIVVILCTIDVLLFTGQSPKLGIYFLVGGPAAFLVFPRHRSRTMMLFVVLASIGAGFAAWRVGAGPAFFDRIYEPAWAVWLGLYYQLAAIGLAFRLASRATSQRLRWEYDRAERLLYSILPEPIATRLKRTSDTIADEVDDVSVLFADIVGFTKLAEELAPEELVCLLDETFSAFDAHTEALGLEKIKTIGDAYMVAGGLPFPREDHLEAMATLALAIRRTIEEGDGRLQVRIGLHAGPVVAGVIGRQKFAYDLWGDTVNTASRMESHGLPGAIQVSEAVWRRLRDRFVFEERGEIEVKGKGPMPAWFLVRRGCTPSKDDPDHLVMRVKSMK